MTVSPVITGLGLGIALAAAPGPVQAILLTESTRGGIGRGLRALAGVHITFGVLLVALAMGLSLTSPSGLALRILRVAGGALLLWLAIDGFRSKDAPDRALSLRGRPSAPYLRGALAILLNPGGWLFLGAVASPLLVSAAERGGRLSALSAAAALASGATLGDLALVIVGVITLRGAGKLVVRTIRLVLALILAGSGLWLLFTGALA